MHLQTRAIVCCGYNCRVELLLLTQSQDQFPTRMPHGTTGVRPDPSYQHKQRVRNEVGQLPCLDATDPNTCTTVELPQSPAQEAGKGTLTQKQDRWGEGMNLRASDW